jgi:type IX secretion system PorP/SprF family membrane protein
MKRIVYILALTAAAVQMDGQQVGMYNHYFFKPFFYNPAFAGNSGTTEAMLLNRSQWMGFSNGPQLNVFTVDGALKEKKAGLGMSLVSDRRGINKRTGGSLSYAYRFNVSEDAYVALGLSAGVVSQSIDYSKVITESYNDLTLFSSSQQKTTIDANAGLVFGWKGLELAASAPQLLGNRIDYLDNSSVTHVSYVQARHYIASLKYKFTLSEEKEMYLAPQGLVRIVPNTPLQYDGNLTFSWKDKFWIGGTYKSDYAVSANVGVSIYKCFDVGYSYEILMGNLAKYAGLSHEIMVNYRFGKHKGGGELDPNAKYTNSDYEHKIDSLHQELDDSKSKAEENDRKIKELNERYEQLKRQIQKIQMQGGIGDYDPYNPNNNSGNNGSNYNNGGNNSGNKGNPNSNTGGNNGGNNSGNNGSNNTGGNNTGNKGNPNSNNSGNNGGNNSGNNGSNNTGGNNSGNKGNPNSNNGGNNGGTISGNNGTNNTGGNNSGNKGNPNSTNGGNNGSNTNAGNNSGNNGNPNSNNGGNNSGNNGSTSSNSGNTSSDQGTKTVEDNVVVISSLASDYKTASGKTPSKGFYVVVGTFFYQDFAMNEAQRFKKNGYSGSNWMYSNSKQYNYVYIKRAGSKQEAIEATKEIQNSGVKDAWIKVLE